MRVWTAFLLAFLAGFSACEGEPPAARPEVNPPQEEPSVASLPTEVDPQGCSVDCALVPKGGVCIEGVRVRCDDSQASCEDCVAQGLKCAEVHVSGRAECKFMGYVNPSCVPDCENKWCGDDGCGGSCGFCPADGVCDGQTCRLAGEACGDVGEEGACVGKNLANCLDGGLAYLDCVSIGLTCGLNEQTNRYECLFQ